MKNLKLIFLFILIVANAAFAQTRVNGKVVGVVNGKILIIEMPNRTRLVAELQYIEVPEAGQPLNEISTQHLRELVLDEIVEFRAKGLMQTRTVGQLFLNGVDVSQQMIRDGAAWYAVLEKDRQDAAESDVYQSNEAQAKVEKRGIWSIENLKPSWEVRAEAKARQERLAQEAFQKTIEQKSKRRTVGTRGLSNNDFQMWVDVDSYAVEQSVGVGGLEMKYDSSAKIGYVATSRAIQNLIAAKNSNQKVDMRVAYVYRDWERGRESVYLVGVLSEAEDWKFLKSNSLTVVADGQRIFVGNAYRLFRRTPSTVQELLLYKISRSSIAKIVGAKKLEVKVGAYSGNLTDKLQLMLRNLLQASA
ncbi:MAG: thermonuclease family protein [Pyrinomonadaceae bacterium]